MKLFFRGMILCLLAAADVAAQPTTYDGRHGIANIDLTVVYFVPKDRTPLPDWKDRVSYYVRRVTAFHQRELDGISKLHVTVPPQPVVSEQTTAYFRRGNQDRTFFDTMDDIKALLPWKPDRETGYPLLLVLSDINWRELDDFRRVRIVEGQPVHEGHVAADGRHFPGAESGGARATYIADPGYGMGLVSGDGWRVPYSGSDCVAYHEGLGHSIGLPHPDPIDDSVMGTGQYHFWINETNLNRTQKLKLGWQPLAVEPDRSGDLFTHFTALPQPTVPKPNEPVTLSFRWPKGASVKSLAVRVQTELEGQWTTVKTDAKGKPPETVSLGKFDHATPVSYRIDVELDDGQTTELWGYFQVKE
jgi:hypothetical protein